MHSSKTLRVVADPAAVSMADAIRAMASTAPLFVITAQALGDLTDELGSMDAALGYLLRLAEDLGHPIGVNIATGADRSSTAFLAPRSWSDERLAGWIAGHHQALEAELGPVVRVRRPR